MAGRDPRLPCRIHLGERGDVGKINRGGKNFGLVRTGFGEQAVDLGQDLVRLLAHSLAFGLIRDLAGEIDRRAVNDGLRHARTGLESGDAHGRRFLKPGQGREPRQ
jgi:hypothetical protein